MASQNCACLGRGPTRVWRASSNLSDGGQAAGGGSGATRSLRPQPLKETRWQLPGANHSRR